MGISLRVVRVRWGTAWRVISAQHPKVPIFETVCDPKDFEKLVELESLTNPRIRQEVGDLSLVPQVDRVSGPGASYVMASFTHLTPDGDRFSTGTFGAYYAGNTLETAVRETVHHRQEFLRKWREPRGDYPMRVLVSRIEGRFHDIRGKKRALHAAYSPNSYRASQRLAADLRRDGSQGIVYESVRHREGECVAVFIPRLVSHCRDDRVLIYHWDGKRISGYTPVKDFVRLQKAG